MTDLSFYEIFFNDCTNPCCVADIDTYEIVYNNRAMVKLLKDYTNYTDKKCYDVIYGKKEPCEFCTINKINNIDFIESRIYNERVGKYFRVNNLLLERNGRRLNLCKYYVTPSYSVNQLTFEEAESACIEILNQSKTENIVDAFMRLLNRFYDPSKAYIYQIDEANNALKKINVWSNNSGEIVLNKSTDAKQLGYLIQKLAQENQYNVVTLSQILESYKDNVESLCKEIPKGYEEIIFSPLHNRMNEVVAFIGLVGKYQDDPDYRLLVSITNFINRSLNQNNIMSELDIMSEFDLLTGFNTRGSYVKQLAYYSKNQPENLGVIFANVNGLRKTNELLGSEQGDMLIKESVYLLKKHFTEPFYRVSGDEFVCFIEDNTEDFFLHRIDRLHNELQSGEAQIFAVGHCYKKGHVDAAKMVAEADTLMYINKQDYYHVSHQISHDVKHNVLFDLLNALDEEEFMVYLQPQFRLKDSTLVGAEALIRRYSKKEEKMVFPDQFIPLYEQNSIIRHVDLFVLEQVCKMISEWKSYNKQIPISVNLSRVTLQEHDIVNTISKICDIYSIDRKYIVLEVTERVGLVENNDASELISSFKRAGFRISLDDFGCAYSNIVTLAQVRFDEVKIDKSLVDNLLTSQDNRIIVKSMIDMCHNLSGTETLAEGIETQEQADLLKEFGCLNVQGYLYSRPIPTKDFFEKYIQVDK